MAAHSEIDDREGGKGREAEPCWTSLWAPFCHKDKLW